MPVTSTSTTEKNPPEASRSSHRLHTFLTKLSKKQKILVYSLLGGLLLAGAGTILYLQLKPTQVASSQTQGSLQTATARQGSIVLSATGTGNLVPVRELSFGFGTSGKVTSIEVQLGDTVEEGQVLGQLDPSAQELALTTAQLNLAEMTSPAAIAQAKQNVAAAESTLFTAQVVWNNLAYKNQSAIDSAYAAYVLANQQYEKVKANYDSRFANLSVDDPTRASAYQQLYTAKNNRDSALYLYNLYNGTPAQRAIDEAAAALDLAQAQLDEAKNYVTALAGGEIPDDATGASLLKLKQAQRSVQSAQEALDATTLLAPFGGMIMDINIQVGETAGGGSSFTIADLSHANIDFYMDQSDWTNVKVGYTVNVIFDALPDQTFTGTVTEVYPGLVSIGGTSMIQGIALLHQSFSEIQLPTGVSAALDVISGQAENVVLVPVEALRKLNENQYAVFVMVNGAPELTIVEVGLQDGTFAEIKSGVKAGDVVTTGVVETQQ